MTAWHIRIGQYGRAFVPAPGPLLAVALWLRGWRPFENISVSRGRWWSKPSRNTARMYPTPIVCWWDGNPRRAVKPAEGNTSK